MPVIESALGVERSFEIAGSSSNIVALAIGLEDYTADLGVQRTSEGKESFYARTRLVVAAKAAGIQPIDSVFSEFADMEALRQNVIASKALGFEGMGCIHPGQISVIRQGFAPGAEEIEKAMKIVAAFEEAAKSGSAVTALGSKMIDPPVVARAQKTIDLAVKLGLLSGSGSRESFRTEFVIMIYTMPVPTVINAAGRVVPLEVNGKPVIPFMGVGKYRPAGNKYGPPVSTCSDYPDDGNKVVASLEEALLRCGLHDGMTISTHHHLRDGDLISNKVFDIASAMGVKDLVWFPSASFPCNDPLIRYLEDGTINRIEGSMNGPLGRFVSEGKMKGTAVLRSHGGRVQAIQDGEVKIDIAVLAAPSADRIRQCKRYRRQFSLWCTGICKSRFDVCRQGHCRY